MSQTIGRAAIDSRPQKRGTPENTVMPTPAVTRPRIPVRLDASCATDSTCPARWNVSTTIRRKVGHSALVPITRLSPANSATVISAFAANGCSGGKQHHQPMVGDHRDSF